MYQLYIANKNYSSWSLRPWVLMTTLGIAFEERLTPFVPGSNWTPFRHFSPSGTVPCLHHNGQIIWDSLAIIEYLAEHHVDVWPIDLKARTWARCAAAEMHSGFSALRQECPMNCAVRVDLNSRSDALERDILRLDELWQQGFSQFGGPYLAGADFSAVDAFFAPVAFRVRSFAIPLSPASMRYVSLLLNTEAMLQWDAAAIAEPWVDQAHDDEIAAAGTIVEDRRTATAG
ncbi:MAG: glutathione S-transferase [Lysobacteraceae bacterium]|nr:MAG: glutathione S-transferase [Xanthomonadaceae bacterium]